ncbi:MAG: type 4a pilus biogenesis protein PilO [Planctomycetaceae bacterium]|nr:type 4a pilus biogenesis protein PilO [Planctomycetales bacterium]MCB9923836.1 type 4a pilus biogenesis protein PilO [Planctomycetaceae bacterium]
MSSDSNDRRLMILGWLFHLGGLITLVVGACAYQFVVSGLITRQQTDNEAEISQLETLLESEGDVGREFSRLQQELARLEASAEAARQRIPETPQESEFLAQVSAAAKEKGLAIKNFTRGSVTVMGTHSQLQIRLTGEGDYASICGFFDEMSTFSRVATVSQMSLTVPSESEIYPLDMTMTLYFGARAPQGGNRG